ncbi:PAS domain S-box protein, partial [bacterium]|nr:PAS domain S-box protein [bacterium]
AKEYIGSAMRGEPQNFYWMHKRKDGVLIDCEVSLASVRVADETLIIAIVRDITERKRAELEQDVVLRILQIGTTSDTQEEMLRSIFAQIGRLVPIENYYLALHDPQLDMISFPIFIDEVDPPPKPRPFGNALTEWVIRHGRPLYLNPEQYAEMERRGEAKVHGTPALSWLGVPLVSQSKPFGALVVQSYRTENLFTDYHVRVFSTVAAQISTLLERKRSEEALRFTQFAVDCAGDGVFWIGPDAHLLYVNDAACKVLARSRAELLKMTWHDIDLYLDRNRWARDWEVVRIKSALSRETIHLTGDGRRIPVEVRANYVELRDHAILCVFARDISERKQSQRELITLRKAIEASGEAVFMADPEGVITFVNAEFARMYGYDPNEIIGHETYRILGGADLDDAAHTVFLERIRGGHVVKGRSVHRTKDGQLIDVEASANPILDENGKLAGFFSILRDVGERVREEQALRDSEESLRWLVDNFGEAVGIVDLEELFVYANPAMGSLFGLPSEELVGRSLGEFMTPEQFAVVRDYTQARRRGVRSRYTVDIRRANGDIRTLLITATPQFDGDGNVRNILTACKDVTGIKIIM